MRVKRTICGFHSISRKPRAAATVPRAGNAPRFWDGRHRSAVALGAQPAALQGMFVRQGLVLTAIGVVAGLFGAIALTRWMSSLLFGVSPLDPATYLGSFAVIVGAAALASFLPARRAATVDPIETLKVE